MNRITRKAFTGGFVAIIALSALAIAVPAVSLYAADPIYCLWCGSSNFANMQQLLTSPCSKSPRKYHDAP